MILNFAEALTSVGGNPKIYQLTRQYNPSKDKPYLLLRFLPEIEKASFSVNGGSIAIYPTMAGLVGTNSNYPPAGESQIRAFFQSTAKVGMSYVMDENMLRGMREHVDGKFASDGGDKTKILAREMVSFYQSMVLGSLHSTTEWMRGRALCGAIEWAYNGVKLTVDYNIPAGNKRDRVGGEAYDQDGSKFWEDTNAARAALDGDIKTVLMNNKTFDGIRQNPANKITTLELDDENNRYLLQKRKDNDDLSEDIAHKLVVTVYNRSGLKIVPGKTGEGAKTEKVRFIPDGKTIFIGAQDTEAYRIGQEERAPDAIGYTHIAPTIEGGAMGRWGRIYVPDDKQYQLNVEGAQNLLPVIENPENLFVLTTELS